MIVNTLSSQDMIDIFDNALNDINTKFNSLNTDERVSMLYLLMQELCQNLGLPYDECLQVWSKACQVDNQSLLHFAKRKLEGWLPTSNLMFRTIQSLTIPCINCNYHVEPEPTYGIQILNRSLSKTLAILYYNCKSCKHSFNQPYPDDEESIAYS